MGLQWRDLPRFVVVSCIGVLVGGILGWLSYSELDQED